MLRALYLYGTFAKQYLLKAIRYGFSIPNYFAVSEMIVVSRLLFCAHLLNALKFAMHDGDLLFMYP